MLPQIKTLGRKYLDLLTAIDSFPNTLNAARLPQSIIGVMKKFKAIAFVASLLFHQWSEANNLNWACSNPTTLFSTVSDERSVLTQVVHPYGAQFTPLYDGTVSVFQLPDLEKRALIQRQLGLSQTIRWPIEHCHSVKKGIFTCYEGTFKQNHNKDLNVQALSLDATTSILETTYGKYHIAHLSLMLRVNGQVHHLVSQYEFNRDCR